MSSIIAMTSVEDPRLEAFRIMADRELMRRRGFFIVEGEHLVVRLLQSGHRVDSVLCCKTKLSRIRPHLRGDTPCYVASEEIMRRIAGFDFHRGVMACGIRPQLPSLPHVLPPAPQPARVVVCAGIYDAENLGLILRSCAAFGVSVVLLGAHTLDPFYRRVIRVSMGAVFSLPLVISDDLPKDLNYLRQQAVSLYAAVADHRAHPLMEVAIERRSAVLLGNEAHGLSSDLQSLCDRCITIPIQPEVDSLNVAMAAAIILHHFQQWSR